MNRLIERHICFCRRSRARPRNISPQPPSACVDKSPGGADVASTMDSQLSVFCLTMFLSHVSFHTSLPFTSQSSTKPILSQLPSPTISPRTTRHHTAYLCQPSVDTLASHFLLPFVVSRGANNTGALRAKPPAAVLQRDASVAVYHQVRQRQATE